MLLEVALGVSMFSAVSFGVLWRWACEDRDRATRYAKELEQHVRDAHELLRQELYGIKD